MAKIPNIMELLGAAPKGLDRRQLQQFLASQQRNQWLDIGPYKTYLRRGMPRTIDPVAPSVTRLNKPLDLANVESRNSPNNVHNLEPGQRPPKGKFRELLAVLEEEALKSGHDSVYVEQIMNEFLPDVLTSAGYRIDPLHARMNPTTPSMYKRLRD